MPALAATREPSGEYLLRAQALVDAIEKSRGEEVSRLIDELTTLRETQLFQELGKLTRDLHDSFKTFCTDAQFDKLARNEMPDARERLKHVITLTQESADKTLSAVEDCVPLARNIGERAEALGTRWDEFRSRKLSVAEFKTLSRELEAYLGNTKADSEALNRGLSEVLMAQGFQDLTGQLIQRVIALVDEVEDKLVTMVALAGARLREDPAPADEPGELEGPVVPALTGDEVVSGQDEVDELLSSLGF